MVTIPVSIDDESAARENKSFRSWARFEGWMAEGLVLSRDWSIAKLEASYWTLK